jgi:4-diphosphocytidyl-2-C-methyl-D-erythritol kinase
VVLEIGRRLLSNPVVASSPAKVNIYFAVGSFLKDGFHKVASCYQALSLREKVLVESSVHFSIDFAGDYKLQSEASVPKDKSNLVYKAGDELIALGAKSGAEKVSFLINKSVPIAGGMAGGSADAAASLVALNELNQSGLEDRFQEAASKLGADVPFSLIGGTAIGLGRGQVLSKIKVETVLHWVMSPSSFGLSTPQVYRKLDVMRINEGVDVAHLEEPAVPEDLIVALQSGDVKSIANLMHNDLEVAAIAIRPELANILDAGRKAGSLRSMVSGSGPTIAHLAKDRVHAEQIANRLHNAGYEAIVTYTSQSGTRLER